MKTLWVLISPDNYCYQFLAISKAGWFSAEQGIESYFDGWPVQGAADYEKSDQIPGHPPIKFIRHMACQFHIGDDTPTRYISEIDEPD